MDRHAMAGIASAVLLLAAVMLMLLGDAEARDFVDNVWIVFGVAFAAFLGESAVKIARRRKSPSSTGRAADREPTRRITGRDGFIRIRTLVDLVGLLMVAFLGTLILVIAGCGGSSAETRPTACMVTNMACQACEAARDRWCGGPPVEVVDDVGGEQ